MNVIALLAGVVAGVTVATVLRAVLTSRHTRRCERLWFACRSPFHRSGR